MKGRRRMCSLYTKGPIMRGAHISGGGANIPPRGCPIMTPSSLGGGGTHAWGIHARTPHGPKARTCPVRGVSSHQAQALKEHVRAPHGKRGAHTLAPLSLPALFFHSPSKIIVIFGIPFRKKKTK
jgi:hypothetical protein